MDVSTIFGIPAHPLFVHIPVIGIPIAFLVLLVFVAMPERRPSLFWGVGVLTVGITIATILTAGSGEKLEDMLPAEDRQSALLHRHTELGDQTKTIMIIFAIVTVIMLALYWYTNLRKTPGQAEGTRTGQDSSGLKTGLMVLSVAAVLLGGLATVWDVRTGHAGAKSSWGDVAAESETQPTNTTTGDGDN